MAELGLPEFDKQFMCSSLGFVTWNSLTKDLCSRYVRNGNRVFDVLRRYETIGAFALSRQNFPSVNKMALPFIHAGGVTDHDAYAMAESGLKLVDGAARALRYVNGLMPAFISTNAYEHQMMAVCEESGFPFSNVNCMRVSFDEMNITKGDARRIRSAGTKITSLPVSNQDYSGGRMKYLDGADSALVDVLDRFQEKDLMKMESVTDALGKLPSLGVNEKAYVLLETRKRTEINFEDTAYVGSDSSDFQAMDMVKDSDGLSVAFNGTEYAVRGSNVAVVGDDATVVSVLVAEFYNGGIEAVFSLLERWDADSLRRVPCADRNLMDAMLKASGGNLPKVIKTDDADEGALEGFISDSLSHRAKNGL